eukprot:Skav201352  [mRNA]  locus=scaffold2643:75342:92343:+ [translate_table: standard]
MTAPTECAAALTKYAKIQGKPVLASWMGGPDVAQGAKVLNDAGIPTYAYPDMVRASGRKAGGPEADSGGAAQWQVPADGGGEQVAAEGVARSEQWQAYGIPVTPCELANSPQEASAAAEKMVSLGIFKGLVSSISLDIFEVQQSHCISAKDTKLYKALLGVRGMGSVDMDQLINIMVRFSVLILDLPEIKECDINPLIASEDAIMALDARVLLHDASVDDLELPQPSIRPYPHQYVSICDLDDGSKAKLRPILPEDEGGDPPGTGGLMRSFYARASWPDGCDPASMPKDDEHLTCSLDRQHLIRTCFVDFDRSIVLVAEVSGADGKAIVGAGRISREEMSEDFTFSLQVLPECRKKGLGSKIMKRLIELSSLEGAACIKADVFIENKRALKFLEAVCGRRLVLRASSEAGHQDQHPSTSSPNLNKVKRPRKSGRHSTVSVALPASIVENAQGGELKAVLVGQVARALTIYGVDEVRLAAVAMGCHGAAGWHRSG